jgi:hypothetical protein
VVYCAEWPDFPDHRVSNIVLGRDATLNAEFRSDLLGGVTVIKGKADAFRRTGTGAETVFTAIPYYAWANRGKGEMAVWIPFDTSAVRPYTP